MPRAVSRLTVHCRHACHRSNSANIMMAFFVSYMMNTKRQCCEHKGSMRRYEVRSDSDERQPRLCTAAVHDRRRTHSTEKAPEACPGASSLQRLACLQRWVSLGVRAGRGGWPGRVMRGATRATKPHQPDGHQPDQLGALVGLVGAIWLVWVLVSWGPARG